MQALGNRALLDFRGCGWAAQGEAWSKATHPPPPNPATPITSPECAAASRVGLERGWACIGLELEYSNTTKNKPEIARKRSKSVPRSPG